MVDNFVNFITDLTFYSAIESLMLYVFTLLYIQDEVNIDKKFVFHVTGLSFISAFCSSFIPVLGLLQICIIFFSILYFYYFVNFNFTISTLMCFAVLGSIMIFEFLTISTIHYLYGYNYVTTTLNSWLRLPTFLIFKMVEVCVLFAIKEKMRLKLKCVWGSIARR